MSEPSSNIAEFTQWVEANRGHRLDMYWFTRPTTWLLNRELVPPGTFEKLPLGGVGIRSDGDFFTDAILPWRFRHIDLKDLVAVLWPECKEEITYGPDTGKAYVEILLA